MGLDKRFEAENNEKGEKVSKSNLSPGPGHY